MALHCKTLALLFSESLLAHAYGCPDYHIDQQLVIRALSDDFNGLAARIAVEIVLELPCHSPIVSYRIRLDERLEHDLEPLVNFGPPRENSVFEAFLDDFPGDWLVLYLLFGPVLVDFALNFSF